MKETRLNLSKSKIERMTLWVLALGVLVAVCLNVARFAVRDYRELQHEIHQSRDTQTNTAKSGGQ
jgi:hypothetical protein